MNQEHLFNRYKLCGLLTFGLMYNMVYIGRFNVNNLIDSISADMLLSSSQQMLITTSLFISYAGGCLVNGFLADKYGGKRISILGASVSILTNVLIYFVQNWSVLWILWLINGYFQGMIWVGGISMLSHWWQHSEIGKGVGIANFFSGFSHVIAYLFPALLAVIMPHSSWRINFIIPMAVLALFTCLFSLLAVENPQKKGLAPYTETDPVYRKREARLKQIFDSGALPFRYFLGSPKFLWWCIIAMLSSICRYGLLNWIPLYFQLERGEDVVSTYFSSLILPLGMAFGTLIISWIAGTLWYKNLGVAAVAATALCGTLIVIFPMIEETRIVPIGIFFTGFFLYGINGLLWLFAIDEGCRVFSGTASGILNCFAYIGASLETFIFPLTLRIWGNMLSIFIIMEIFCIIMVLCGIAVTQKNSAIEPESFE